MRRSAIAGKLFKMKGGRTDEKVFLMHEVGLSYSATVSLTPCDQMFSLFMIVNRKVGRNRERGQISVWQDENILPRWSSGLSGETAIVASSRVRRDDPETRSRLDRAQTLSTRPEIRLVGAEIRSWVPREEVGEEVEGR